MPPSYELKRLTKPQVNPAGLILGSYLTLLHGDRFFTLPVITIKNAKITTQLNDAVARDPSQQK